MWYGKRLFEQFKQPNGGIFKLVYGSEGFETAWVKYEDGGIGTIESDEFIGTFVGRLGPKGTWVINYGKEHPTLGTFYIKDGQLVIFRTADTNDTGS